MAAAAETTTTGTCYCGENKNVRVAFPSKRTKTYVEIKCPHCNEKHRHGIEHTKFLYRISHCRSHIFVDKPYCIHLSE